MDILFTGHPVAQEMPIDSTMKLTKVDNVMSKFLTVLASTELSKSFNSRKTIKSSMRSSLLLGMSRV
jgi:hypothetical protein